MLLRHSPGLPVAPHPPGELVEKVGPGWALRRRSVHQQQPEHACEHLPPAAWPLAHPGGAEAGSWVRIKGGLYKGDLAKVMDTDPSTQVGASSTAHRSL